MLAEITDPLALVGKQAEYDITVKVNGGGLAGQVDAIKLAISKALTVAHADLRPVLKKAEFLKRDPREKERKKRRFAICSKTRTVLETLILQKQSFELFGRLFFYYILIKLKRGDTLSAVDWPSIEENGVQSQFKV